MHLGETNVSPGGAGTFHTGTLGAGGEGFAHGFEGGGDLMGVWGASNTGRGVVGTSWDGGGVVGAGGSVRKDPELRPPGPGVIGFAPAAAPGVLAISANDPGPGSLVTPDGGLALEVLGRGHVQATTEGFALDVQNDGTTDSSGGVLGVTQGLKPAVMGDAIGAGEQEVGVVGVSSLPPVGEHFGDGAGTGVRGTSGTGKGVHGISGTGWAVHGESTDGVGVVASAGPTGEALHVAGRAAFETAGSGVVPAGQESVLVTNAAATTASHIMVTPVGDPGARSIRWVSRAAGTFTVHLTSAPANKRPATPFTYLIVEPG